MNLIPSLRAFAHWFTGNPQVAAASGSDADEARHEPVASPVNKSLARPHFTHDAAASEHTVDFLCNICGTENRNATKLTVQNREAGSCGVCQSSLRMRSVIHALSCNLFGTGMPLPDFPFDRSISGIGMSDWDGYANQLEGKFDYQNTFYHKEPQLDITDISDDRVGIYDFVISTDVFEHIPISGLRSAFNNAYLLLKSNGIFIFTAPFTKTGMTEEHFPNLHNYRIVEDGGEYVLENRTPSGETEQFRNLVFHGGPGTTLEMRIFSEPDLIDWLIGAGFSDVQVCSQIVEEFGILWPMDWAVPIVARRS